MRESKLNILWLSDIHFYKLYSTDLSDKESFNEYLSSFQAEIYSQHRKRKIDYILITGDLAQQGTKDDYYVFWDMLLKPLLDTFFNSYSTPKVITIPGNHDVNWENSDFFIEYIQKIKAGISYPERNHFLESKLDPYFLNLFKDYTDFIKKYVLEYEDEKYKVFFDFDKIEYVVSPSYVSNALYGYIVDHNKNAIFILFNSAWFSLGDKFNEMYSKYLATKYTEKNVSVESFKKILDNKDFLSEFDNQILGINFFDLAELNTILNSYPDYFVTTCMHHSLNWLNWHEYYSYEFSYDNNARKLNSILEKSDILLTGHEHVPNNYDNQRLLNDTLYLRAGCFLFDNQIKKIDLSYSWFSILDINIDTGSMKQYRFVYKQKRWDEKKTKTERLTKKDSKYNLVDKRKLNLLEKIKNTDCNIIKKYFNTYKNQEVISVNSLSSEYNEAMFFELQTKNDYELCIVSLCESFYSAILQKNFYKLIDTIMQTNDFKYKVITLLVLDLYVDNVSFNAYKDTTSIGRTSTFTSIYKKGDTLFDFFRQHFFSRFEEETNVENIEYFPKYYNLLLVNNVIPYWIYEKFFQKD
jgi:predicted phosphodiesterase